MAKNANEVIQDRCRQSRTLASQIEQLMPTVSPCCRRHDFAACAVDLALGHHRAIVMLVEVGELGTAAALIRPLLEASASAFWLVYAASGEEVMALPTEPAVETSDHDIPMLSEMATALTPYFPEIVTLTGALSKKGSRTARWLHKYTHGGTPQLARRDRANGWLEAEVILALLRADMFACVRSFCSNGYVPERRSLPIRVRTARHPWRRARRQVWCSNTRRTASSTSSA